MHTQEHLKECIKLCWECRDTCQRTLYNHILERGGSHISVENVSLMTDCIQICQIAADFMTRNSAMHSSTCRTCADICEACAVSCENMGKQHIVIQTCAEVCHRCAASCREMSNK